MTLAALVAIYTAACLLLPSESLLFMSIAIVLLLVGCQYVALTRNKRLCSNLGTVSRDLQCRVTDLAQMNQRLEELNDSYRKLTSLRHSAAVARAGLETACAFVDSPGGWVSIGEGDDKMIVTHGFVEDYPQATQTVIDEAQEQGLLRSVKLTVGSDDLGTLWLLTGADHQLGSDLVPLVATQLASALDNAKRYEEALQLAERDPLTGLFNHRGIHRRLAGEVLRAQHADSELSVIMIDLDDFKILNDTFGHVAGDLVLRQVSDAIKTVLRHTDLAGRIGGDELLLVLPNTSADGALQLGERLRVELADRPYLTSSGESIPVYLSLGVATMPADAQSVGHLIEVADTNLYTSKQHGGNNTTGSGGLPRDDPESLGTLGIADRLLDAVGARDHYTRRHSEHVVRNAMALGEAVGLSDESLRTLRMAAMLHDIGKIGISTELLRRPRSLTPEEEEQMRQHVPLGVDLILDIPRLSEVAKAVSAHHERYDGSGYPAQTAGDEIPVLSRILAVADAYSAMTLDRPYRHSLSRAEAKDELMRSAGTQFDPELVDAFVEMLDAREGENTGEYAVAG